MNAAAAAGEFKHSVEQDDMVVMASDGLFDNLTDEMIMQCFGKTAGPGSYENVDDISECIAMKAEVFSMDRRWDSPFAQNARAEGRRYAGGKQDDITVIVS